MNNRVNLNQAVGCLFVLWAMICFVLWAIYDTMVNIIDTWQ